MIGREMGDRMPGKMSETEKSRSATSRRFHCEDRQCLVLIRFRIIEAKNKGALEALIRVEGTSAKTDRSHQVSARSKSQLWSGISWRSSNFKREVSKTDLRKILTQRKLEVLKFRGQTEFVGVG